jgi:hypothetical protein
MTQPKLQGGMFKEKKKAQKKAQMSKVPLKGLKSKDSLPLLRPRQKKAQKKGPNAQILADCH